MAALGRRTSNVSGPLMARQMAAKQTIRWVTVWPQWPYDAQQGNAKPIGDRLRRWPLQGQTKKEVPVAKQMSPKEVEVARAKAHLKIWQDMIKLDWSSWERRFWDLRERSIPYDEVTYTLLLHGYLLSHRHSGEVAYHVIEEMRKASIHPALVRLNKRLVDAAFELQALDARPEASAWRNLVRMSYHCAVRFQKKRRTRLRDELEGLEPDELLALNTDDAQRWLERHDKLALPLSSNGVNRFLPSADGGKLLGSGRGEKKGRFSRTSSSPNLLLGEESDLQHLIEGGPGTYPSPYSAAASTTSSTSYSSSSASSAGRGGRSSRDDARLASRATHDADAGYYGMDKHSSNNKENNYEEEEYSRYFNDAANANGSPTSRTSARSGAGDRRRRASKKE